MGSADLDQRLAEAAAAVQTLRQESRQLDLELEERRSRAAEQIAASHARADCASSCNFLPSGACVDMNVTCPTSHHGLVKGPAATVVEAAADAASALEHALRRDEVSLLDEQTLLPCDPSAVGLMLSDSTKMASPTSLAAVRPAVGGGAQGLVDSKRDGGIDIDDVRSRMKAASESTVDDGSAVQSLLFSPEIGTCSDTFAANAHAEWSNIANVQDTLGYSSTNDSVEMEKPTEDSFLRSAQAVPAPSSVFVAAEDHATVYNENVEWRTVANENVDLNNIVDLQFTASGVTESVDAKRIEPGWALPSPLASPASAATDDHRSWGAPVEPAHMVTPVPPQAPGPNRPPRPAVGVRKTSRSRRAAEEFPTDEVVATMSRRERIALLERTGDERGGAADGGELKDTETSLQRRPKPRPPPAPSEKSFASNEFVSQMDRGASGYGDGRVMDAAQGSAVSREGSLSRRSRPWPPAPASEQSFPSDEALSQMSRRERVALLSKQHEGSGTGAGTVRRREDSSHRRRDAQRQAATALVSSTQDASLEEDAGEQLGDSDWLEQRRQNRKLRLQQRSTNPRGGGQGADGGVESNMGLIDAFLPACGRGASSSSADALHGRSAASTGAPATGSVHPPTLEELEDLARLPLDGQRWAAACQGLACGAHKLSAGALVKAIEVVGNAAWHGCGREQMATMVRGAAEALLACVTPHLGALDASMVVDALRVMAVGKVQEQTFLDMLLAQMLVLHRRDPSSFGVALLSDLAGALGALHEVGLSAKRASSGASSAANRRCVEALGSHILELLTEFGARELSQLGGPFIVYFLDDTQRRAVLRRAADLNAGIASTDEQAFLPALKEVERAVRQHSFAFIASLPDETKDYLMRLKASDMPTLEAALGAVR